MPRTYWTKRTRQVFSALARRGKVSIRDLLVEAGLEGEIARSSFMQSLARWKEAGLVQVDTSAPRNYPRYALTPAGRQAWDEAAAAARAKTREFFEYFPGGTHAPAGVAPATYVRSPAEDGGESIVCRDCGAHNETDALYKARRGRQVPLCQGCGKDLTRELNAFDDR